MVFNIIGIVKWCYYQETLTLQIWRNKPNSPVTVTLDLAGPQQITDMFYVREIAEKFLITLLLLFICWCYFIPNARRDTAADKKFDIAIQIALEHVLVKRLKKKNILKKK